MDRRTFLKGALTVGAVAAVPNAFRALAWPMLWGDGIHDDAAAFNALANGRPFRTIDGFRGVVRDGVALEGRFRLDSPFLVEGGTPYVRVERCLLDFSYAEPAASNIYVDVRACKGFIMRDCHIRLPYYVWPKEAKPLFNLQSPFDL